MSVTVRFIGTGNAFADGGRSHACIHLTAPGASLLLDCGGSALPAIKRVIDPATIDGIAISHLHGDHFGGVPYVVMEQHYAGRTAPLTVIGPPELRTRAMTAGAALFQDFFGGPGGPTLGYPVEWVVLDEAPATVGGAEVSGHPVKHVPESQPHGLRVRIGDRLIAYSGDATWSDALPRLADGADLFICEATSYATPHPVHLSVDELRAHRSELRCGRLVLTHLGNETLARLGELGDLEPAQDGTLLEL